MIEAVIMILIGGSIGLGFKIIYDWLKSPKTNVPLLMPCQQPLKEIIKTQEKLLEFSNEVHDTNIEMVLVLNQINQTLLNNGKILERR